MNIKPWLFSLSHTEVILVKQISF